ncbi:anthranilate synthase component I [Athalassotoga saccharophila]|uniref:anthranilate synthase component I n=1 Tax=Athalassotoga saccharophila TaxID=1441386 RepID=UPI0013797A50|nr:anthranilate synthase component I [Athalassotoga saccharophila]BBJ28081.1 anthranilate synthase component 1 [Athalassotoga saccharophila]
MKIKVNLTREKFEDLKDQNKVFPFFAEINGDEITPIGIFYSLKGKHKFLLESAEQGRNGRYSFIGADPYLKIGGRGNEIEIYNSKKENGRILDYAKNLFKMNYDNLDLKVPFTGGAVGYVGYDVIRQYEKIPETNPDELKIPDSYLMFYKNFITFDHLTHKIFIVKNIFEKDSYNESLEEFEKIAEDIKKVEIHDLPPTQKKEFKSNFTEEEFCKIVEKAKSYIRSGDIFQVVLSQRLSVENSSEPFEVYRRLRSINPSPYLFFIDFGDFQMAGSSPESLVSVFNGRIMTNPIAGTRPRGRNENEDKSLALELIKDEKERAEHLMLVDLGRNDIGKISEFGSVKVEKFMEIEMYSHVMHIVSTVSGKLKSSFTPFDALISCLPAGTVSGAPKIRAMEIIEELENIRRSFYAGSVGYFSFSGNMDMCIAIRTILFKDQKAYIQGGAGIVYDSDPHREYYETLNKLKALQEAI